MDAVLIRFLMFLTTASLSMHYAPSSAASPVSSLLDCDNIEKKMMIAMSNGYDKGKAWMLIGTCRYENAEEISKPVCTETEEEYESSPYIQKRSDAIDAFVKVQHVSNRWLEAQKWISFIEEESEAFRNRCKQPHSQPSCFTQIKKAYDTESQTGKFILHNKNCRKFVKDFNRVFKNNTD